MNKTSEAQIRSVRKYNKENVKKYYLDLNKKTDADIISFLETADNKQGSIKEAIREYMNKGK